MKKNTKFQIVTDIILLVLTAALTVGVELVFHACDKKPDGSYMACHWAQQAIFAFGIAMTAAALMRLVLRDSGIKTGLSLALIPAAVMTAVIPNNLIKLCMMTNMHCHTMMRPTVIIISIAIAAAAVVSIIADRGGKEK